MAKRVIDGAILSDIADATRNLTGATGMLTPAEITSLLQGEIDAGKVKLETCTVTLTNVENRADMHYMRPGYGYFTYYITPMDSGNIFDMYKNTIIALDTNCSSCIVKGNISLLSSEYEGYYRDYLYVLSIMGDGEIELLYN